MGGLGIVAPANPSKGTSFEIRFSPPCKPTGSVALAAKVSVIHSVYSRDEGGFKIGLIFEGADEQRAAAVRQLLT